MGMQWFKNMAGLNLEDHEMQTIPFPTLELGVHVTTKTVQAGGVLATIITAPVMTLAKGPRSFQGYVARLQKHLPRGALVGLVLGPLFTYLKVKSLEQDGISDRSYRIRNNRNQVRVDQGSVVGGLLGGGLAATNTAAFGVVPGVMAGITAGTLVAAAYNMHHGDKHS